MGDLKEFAERIANFTPSEAKELQGILEEVYGIEAPDTGVVFVDTVEEVEVEAQTEFDVVLEGAGTSKLNVVKAVKDITGLGLRESKALVDSAPTPIKEGVSQVEAQTIQSKLEAVGAKVTIV